MRHSARRCGNPGIFASAQALLGSALCGIRVLCPVAGCAPSIDKTALRSLAMEITAIIVFTAIALWFVTEVGGENL
jgi:hypothetical protein